MSPTSLSPFGAVISQGLGGSEEAVSYSSIKNTVWYAHVVVTQWLTSWGIIMRTGDQKITVNNILPSPRMQDTSAKTPQNGSKLELNSQTPSEVSRTMSSE